MTHCKNHQPHPPPPPKREIFDPHIVYKERNLTLAQFVNLSFKTNQQSKPEIKCKPGQMYFVPLLTKT